MANSQSEVLAAIDLPSLDLQRGPVHVDIGWLGDADHRNAFRMIFERVLEENRGTLEPMSVIAIGAKRPLEPQSCALVKLPVEMREVIADAAQVADVLYDSHNTQLELELRATSAAATLRVSFDNPAFQLSWHAPAP